MPRVLLQLFLVLVLPPVVIGVAYDQILAHRSDYLGHFLAGFGGTLGTITLALWAIPTVRFLRLAGWVTLAVVLGCIGLGAVLEETLYRIAKWDEVDFCNQSLGAVLAGLGALAVANTIRQHLEHAAIVAGWAGVALLGGYYFAFR